MASAISIVQKYCYLSHSRRSEDKTRICYQNHKVVLVSRNQPKYFGRMNYQKIKNHKIRLCILDKTCVQSSSCIKILHLLPDDLLTESRVSRGRTLLYTHHYKLISYTTRLGYNKKIVIYCKCCIIRCQHFQKTSLWYQGYYMNNLLQLVSSMITQEGTT